MTNDELDSALDHLELKLLERWHELVHDAVVNAKEIPEPLSGRTGTLWEHRTPEVFAHVSYGQVYEGCAYLNWYRGGHVGTVQSITCDGKIRERRHYDLETIEWQGVEVELPEYTECRIGELFAAAEEWSSNDRKVVAGVLPALATHDLTALKDARDALVAGATGDAAFQTLVDLVFVDRQTGSGQAATCSSLTRTAEDCGTPRLT